MNIRSGLVAGAAALVSAQSVYAAPVTKLQPVDPLIAVSALGTPQSRAAVSTTVAAAVTQGAVPPDTRPLAANEYPPRPPYYQNPGAWAYLPFLLGLIAIIALHITDDDDRRPVSP